MGTDIITMEEASDVLVFWFEELESTQWFARDDSLDSLIRSRFSAVHEAACRCELWPWRATHCGRLAEIIVLDQFSRNIHRDSAAAFVNDSLALALAQEAISVEADKPLTPEQKAFLYMPFMHSESLQIHEVAMQLFAAPGLDQQFKFEKDHHDVLLRFGRYPHRNEVLGRPSTPEEQEFLQNVGAF